MTAIPSSRNMEATVDFPMPTEPVRPNSLVASRVDFGPDVDAWTDAPDIARDRSDLGARVDDVEACANEVVRASMKRARRALETRAR